MASPRPERRAPSAATTDVVDPQRALQALGDPSRRRLVLLLSGGERSVVDLVADLQAAGPISQPAVSQHLRVLLEAGLVSVRADGVRRRYRIDPAGVAAVQGWLAQLLDPTVGLGMAMDALETEVARGRSGRRRASGASRATGT